MIQPAVMAPPLNWSSSENHRRHPRGPRGFESRSLQGGVWCEPDFRFNPASWIVLPLGSK
jgi:hypothetical protein